MTIFDVDIAALGGGPAELDRYRGAAVLVVNVASRRGLTGQYAGLPAPYAEYRDRGPVAPDGTDTYRFAPPTDPQDGALLAAVEKLLPR